MRVCPQCAAYRAQIVLLKLKIEQLHRKIRILSRRLERIRDYAFGVLADSKKVLMQPAGVKRGEWAYHKGRYEVAKHVLEIIRDG